jgi:predicted amidophosphoribosyltransferase
MKGFRFCGHCGRPWARHVSRCPGCGRHRAMLFRIVVAAGASAWLVALWLGR